jgi:hypothetical protein
MKGIKISRVTACLLAVTLLVAGFLSSHSKASAQRPKGIPKWEYATLHYEEPLGDSNSFAAWTTSKARLTAKSKTHHHESLSKISKDLGGDKNVGIDNVCILLTRVGREGWELVAHTKTVERGNRTFTWTFKRPVQ